MSGWESKIGAFLDIFYEYPPYENGFYMYEGAQKLLKINSEVPKFSPKSKNSFQIKSTVPVITAVLKLLTIFSRKPLILDRNS